MGKNITKAAFCIETGMQKIIHHVFFLEKVMQSKHKSKLIPTSWKITLEVFY